MKYFGLISCFTTVLFSILVGCNTPRTKQLDLTEARKSIEAQNAKWFVAIRQYDIAVLMSLYTDDATIMPPNFPMLKGSNQIKTYYERMPARGIRITKGAFTTLELSGNDSTVYEIGEYVMNIEHSGSPSIADTGKYNTIWKLQNNGKWKIYADCWNSNKLLRLIQANK